MSYALEVDPRAERDIEEAIDYYERARVGLGAEFLEVLRATFERVVTAPEACAPVPRSKAARFALVRGFPHRVVFILSADHVSVVAVVHASRRPSYWRERL